LFQIIAQLHELFKLGYDAVLFGKSGINDLSFINSKA
jgi:hypothetical protein